MVELTKEELYLRVKKIAKPVSMVDGDWVWGLEPYDRTRVAPKVRNLNLKLDFLLLSAASADYRTFGNLSEKYHTAGHIGRGTSTGEMGRRPDRIRCRGSVSSGGGRADPYLSTKVYSGHRSG